MLSLLLVTAHPDDEAGSFGGSLLLYAERGIKTHVLCLTPGQAARNRGAAASDAELIAMRREEFFRSCEILKVSHGEILDLPDAGLDRYDFSEMAEQVTRRVRVVRPHVMLTFGPEGGVTAHPDHSMASLAATAAFHWAGRANRYTQQLQTGLKPHQTQKLYYASAAFKLPDREFVALPPTSATIEIAPYLETKLAAFKAHTSQNPLYERFSSMVQKHGAQENFLLAASKIPQSLHHETDLFSNVIED